MGKIHVVTCGKGAEKVVWRITLGEPIIGLACTGVAVGPKGQLSLVVLTTGEGDVYVFDVKKYPDIMYQGLGRLIQSVHILKVVHDSGPISANLQAHFGISLTNMFDTQVAYSLMLEKQGLCPRKVPLQALCEKCGVQQHTPSLEFQRLLSEDMHAWARRPLNHDMLNTVASLALPLVPTLHQQMMRAINEDSWDWFCALNDKARLSLMDPKSADQSAHQKRSHKPEERPRSQLPVFTLSPTQRALIKGTVPPALKS
ncbi:hypothetical protein ACOMHN_031634 [Nucella lapillus]